MISIYIKKIEKLGKGQEENIIALLSSSARSRLNKKRNEALRLASLCALSLIPENMLCHLEYTKSGIPYFNSINSNISISHSSTYCAVAISDLKIGIDVEDTNSEADYTKYKRFFTENEQKIVGDATSSLEIWTKKEALFKYLKNDDINFISLDTTQTDVNFKSINLDSAILTLCTEKEDQIEIIDSFKF